MLDGGNADDIPVRGDFLLFKGGRAPLVAAVQPQDQSFGAHDRGLGVSRLSMP